MRRRVLARSRVLAGCACAAVAAAVAGCATTASSSVTATGNRLTIYASVPPQPTAAQQDVMDAEQLAWTEAGGQGGQLKVGKFTIKFVPLSGREITHNARTAVEDTSTIAYLGELIPGTSDQSVEINNEEGILEVSPTDTALELTQATPVVPGSPLKYYPSRSTYGRTFGRVVPSAAQEAKVQAQEMVSLHVRKLYVADDGQPYGDAIAYAVRQDAAAAGITAVAGPATAAGFTSSGAGALFFGSNSDGAAAQLFGALATGSPTAKLFGPSALDDDAFAASLASAAPHNLYISAPGFLPKDLTPAGKRFVGSFETTYHRAPALEAIFGYAAMQATLYAIDKASPASNNRAAVVGAFLSIKDFTSINQQASVLGSFSINDGDPSFAPNPAPFVFSRLRAGRLVPFKFLQAPG